MTGSGGLRVGSFSAAGEHEWMKDVLIADATSASWSAIAPTAGGEIVAGSVRRGTAALERPTLVMLDTDGNVLEIAEIDMGPGIGDASFVALGEAPNGDLLAVGDVAFTGDDSSVDDTGALVVRLDASGTLLATTVLDNVNHVTGVAVQPDGSYAISASTHEYPGARTEPLVASFRADDTLEWTALYADRIDAPSSTATGIAAVDGDDYVVSGTAGISDEDAWMIRVDDTGMPVWSKSYVGAESDEFLGVVAMPSGIAAFGHTTTPASDTAFADLWVVRTAVDGMVHFDPASGFDTVNDAVQWRFTDTHSASRLLTALNPAPAVDVDDSPVDIAPAVAVDTLLG